MTTYDAQPDDPGVNNRGDVELVFGLLYNDPTIPHDLRVFYSIARMFLTEWITGLKSLDELTDALRGWAAECEAVKRQRVSVN